MKTFIRLIVSLMTISAISQAQVAEYYFTQQNLSYSEITGGVELWSTTFDNEVSGEIAIPSFTFNGAAYTSLFVSANGFITFGIAPAGTNYTPISSTATYAGCVSAFGRDVNQAATGAPSVRYEQVGNEFVIQWKDVRRKDISGEIISFQIRLNTSNNYILIVYGGSITPGSNTTYPQVGLRGPDNTLATNIHNRTIASAGGNWINSTRGTGTTNTMYFNSATPATVPSPGLTYTFKPLYNPLNFTATGVSLNQIDLSWQKNSLNHNVMLAFNTSNTFGTPVSGQVYSAGNAITGGGTVLFYGNGTSFSHTGLNPNTVYYYKIWSYDAVPDYSQGMTADTRTAYALPYLQAFPTSSLPAEWLSDMSRSNEHGTSGTYGLYKRLYSSATTTYATAPLAGSISANTYLSFHYRFVDYTGFPYVATTLGVNDKLEIQVSTDDGATFTTFHTIDYTNHTATTVFTNKAVSLAAYAGDFIRIKFLCTWASGDYYFDLDNVLIEDGTNMSYTSNTVEQPNLSNVAINSTDNDILRLEVVTQKSSNPLSLTSITFNTTGCTNAGTDVAAAKVFFTTTPVFSTGTQFGSTLSNPSGTFTINGSQELAQGNNYFWLAYDIKSTATPGNVVDGQCTKFITSESPGDKLTNKTTITGSRKIGTVVNGVKTVPGDYSTIAEAVLALNNGVVGPDGVTVNVAAGYLENITAPIVLTATGSSTQPIIFQKSGSGNNPLVTHTGAGTVSTSTIGYNGDAVIIIEGGDYITFENIDVAAQQQGVEYGYYLRKFSVTDGCKHVAIKNATITMIKGTSRYVTGICAGNNSAASNNITITSPDASHDYITITGNSINNVFCGMYFRGSTVFYDQYFTVGSTGYGNTIHNFGGNSANETWGIYLINNKNSQFNYNTINNLTGNSGGFTSSAAGIYNAITTDGDFTAENNNINLTSVSSRLYGIYNSSMGLLNLNDNTIAISSSSSSTAEFAFIYNHQSFATTSHNTNINNNVFAASTIQSSNTTYLIYNNNSRVSPEVTNIQGNSTSGTIDRSGTSGTMYLYYNAGSATGTENISGNNFSSVTLAGSASFYGIYSQTNAAHTQNIYNNTYSTITGGSGTVYIIYLGNSSTRSVYGNDIYGITGAGIVCGIYMGSGSNPALIYKNEVYDLSSGSTSTTVGAVSGIIVNSGTAVYLYNNFISDLKAPSINSGDAIRGIALTSTQANSTIGLYYNTVYLNTSATGPAFGSCGIYQTSSSTSTTATLDMRNNIIVNTSVPGGANYTAAFRRSAGTLGNYGSSSNYNVFYAGTPGQYNVIYYSGIGYQTIDDYKALVGPNRDSLSFSENPPFQNITTTPYNLRLTDGMASACESGGRPITSPIAVTDDFDGAVRPSLPDIGADEFAGTSTYVEVPASLSATALNSQQIKLEFESNTSMDDVVIVFNATGNFTDPVGTPVLDGSLAGGTVIYIGTTSPVVHTGLTTGTPVYYKAFCYNGANYSYGITTNATPIVTPVTNFSATHSGQSAIDMSWTKNIYDHDVIVTCSTAYFSGNPVQGTSYNVGDPVTGAGTVIYKGPLSAYNHGDLDPWIQYYYKIWSVDIFNYYSSGITANAITDAEANSAWPYLQDFDGSWAHSPSAPPGWRVVDVGGSGSLTWVRYTVSSHSSPASARGYGNGACNDYLISPQLILPDTSLQLSWYDKVSLTTSNNSYKVLLSTTNSQVTSFTTELADINCTNTDWVLHTLDLTPYKGQNVFLAFYQYYSQSQYQYFTIDDILIETLIPGAASLVSPLEGLLTFTEATLSWEAPLSSDPITGYKVYLDESPDPSTLVYDGVETSYSPSGLAYGSDYYWKVVPYNTHGEAINPPVWSFSTVNSTQLAESFESNYFPPVSWSNTTGWFSSSTSAIHGVRCASSYTPTISVQFLLITPLVSITNGNKVEFFAGTSSSPYQRIQLKYSADKITWNNIGDPIDITYAAWGFHSIDLSVLAGNNYYLAFTSYYISPGISQYIYLDHVTGPEIVPILPATATNPDPPNFDSYVQVTPALSWEPIGNGGIPSGYKVYLDNTPDPTTLIYNGPNETCPAGTLSVGTTYYWKVIPYNIVGDAANCPVWSFTTVPEGGVQVGRDDIDYLDLPIYVDYSYSYSQTIYLQSELNMANKRIDRIYYQWNGAPDGTENKDWVIYMGHTPDDEFLNNDEWLPTTQMTMVFVGEVELPGDNAASWIEIILDTPFEYNNIDNLVIAVDENSDGYGTSGGYFYGTESEFIRALLFYDDVSNPDPASPPLADNLISGLANIRLLFDDMPTGPEIRVLPESKDFGQVVLDLQSDPEVFMIKNNGIGTLSISAVDLAGADYDQFILIDTNTYPKSLGANESLYISASFTPTSEGLKSAFIEVYSNTSGSPLQVSLNGEGLDLAIHTFPFTETFEDDSPTRNLWTQIQETGIGVWTYASGAGGGSIQTAHGGTKNARFTGSSTLKITKLISPVFDLTGVADPQLIFWYGQEFWSPDQNELKIYYRTAFNQPWIQIFHDDTDRNVWTEGTLSLPNPSSVYQLAFEGIDNYGYPNVLDDVTVGPLPPPVTTWLGSVSTDWTDPANWSDGVPTAENAVIIDSQNFDPVVGTAVTVYSVSVQTGSVVTITSTGSLNVTGP